eukprot:GDKI01043211.1.p1 GENE.GDKI01043211.1~~GDKI01043211.1.p1  ORF type:complete len:107 (-),score=25.95 GDKI01043211.1:87-407(-)
MRSMPWTDRILSVHVCHFLHTHVFNVICTNVFVAFDWCVCAHITHLHVYVVCLLFARHPGLHNDRVCVCVVHVCALDQHTPVADERIHVQNCMRSQVCVCVRVGSR